MRDRLLGADEGMTLAELWRAVRDARRPLAQQARAEGRKVRDNGTLTSFYLGVWVLARLGLVERVGTREARNRDGSANAVLLPAVLWRITEQGRAAPDGPAWANPWASRYRRDPAPSGR